MAPIGSVATKAATHVVRVQMWTLEGPVQQSQKQNENMSSIYHKQLQK